MKEHNNKVGHIIEQHKNAPKEALIARLNPVITGWCNYSKTVGSQDTFEMADFVTFHQLFGWADKRHRGKKAAAADGKRVVLGIGCLRLMMDKNLSGTMGHQLLGT
ncbi:group II intron maturase-specific domain-containing protein [Microseira sp. BLCC-F43]|uniref:group II intron maturase-specific domain-containing protein n=1 Tax=Microseira sp. BLCC-F43 TaxID=3153602 RepID=UPI0035BB0BB0